MDYSQNRVHDVLQRMAALLSDCTASPRLDAELLLCEVLHCDRSYLYAHPEKCLAADQQASYSALTARRQAGEPIAYIRGFKDFWSLRLHVTADVLIPRPETELLVELALRAFPLHQVIKVADLGTGSGAIALAIATERPFWEIIATDESNDALRIAQQNARRLHVNNVRFLAGDWFQPLAGQTFDLVLSNPPYVEQGGPHGVNDLSAEPSRALLSGNDGMDDLKQIIDDAKDYLRPTGYLIIEHGCEQGTAVREQLKRQGYTDVATHQDLAGLERATSSRWPGTKT